MANDRFYDDVCKTVFKSSFSAVLRAQQSSGFRRPALLELAAATGVCGGLGDGAVRRGPSCVSFVLQVSICLECNSSKLRGLKRKWIRCSAQATVLHLKKFIAKKLNLSSFNEVAHLAACAPRPAREAVLPSSLGSATLEILNQKKTLSLFGPQVVSWGKQ